MKAPDLKAIVSSIDRIGRHICRDSVSGRRVDCPEAANLKHPRGRNPAPYGHEEPGAVQSTGTSAGHQEQSPVQDEGGGGGVDAGGLFTSISNVLGCGVYSQATVLDICALLSSLGLEALHALKASLGIEGPLEEASMRWADMALGTPTGAPVPSQGPSEPSQPPQEGAPPEKSLKYRVKREGQNRVSDPVDKIAHDEYARQIRAHPERHRIYDSPEREQQVTPARRVREHLRSDRAATMDYLHPQGPNPDYHWHPYSMERGSRMTGYVRGGYHNEPVIPEAENAPSRTSQDQGPVRRPLRTPTRGQSQATRRQRIDTPTYRGLQERGPKPPRLGLRPGTYREPKPKPKPPQKPDSNVQPKLTTS